jgi:NAD(P)-dependent dehydrogenase (short-subunit alcohol dehydrogenase family)
MNGRFESKVALVTGGASGIGLATVKRFLAEGAAVVVVDRDSEKGAPVAASLGDDALFSACDVSREEDVAATVARTLEWRHRIDVVVNNAGLMIFKPLEDHTLDDWNRVLSVDLLGAFLFTREAFRAMPNGGTVVNVSSVHAVETTANVAAYAAAKAALVALTRSASIEGKPRGIRVNAVLPGAVDTPMLRNNPNVKAGLEVINKTDVGKPEDIAALIAYLASDDSRFVQGAAVLADGGRLTHL